MLALLSAGLAGCHAGDPDAANEAASEAVNDSAQEFAATTAAACVEFRGLKHCALGAAGVALGKEGGQVEVTKMEDPRRDGVSILLPDVSGFEPTGWIENSETGVSYMSSAFQGGSIVGRMTLQETDESYVVSAAFTGTGGSSPYQVNLYARDELVGVIGDLQSGQQISLRRPPRPRWPVRTSSFHNNQTGPNVGACRWRQSFAGHEVTALLPDGRAVVADRIELEEVIPRGGSYPYMSFNRIDYTSDSSAMVFSDQRIE